MTTTATKKDTMALPGSQVVRVGVGVIVKDPSSPLDPRSARIFAGVRKNSHGAGKLALPGGHLEMYESFVDCAIREVKEECDLDLDANSLRVGHVTNDPMPNEHKHYVTIFMIGECLPLTDDGGSGGGRDGDGGHPMHHHQQPKTMEPHKCEGWNSYTWEDLKAIQQEGKLFGPLHRVLDEEPPKVLKFLGIS